MFRIGKSSLLNRLLGLPVGYQGGFGVGHKAIAKTQGLWIWPRSVKVITQDGQKVNLIFIDVEGFDDPQKFGDNSNVPLYMLALLSSSHTILNCKETIDKTAIEKLALVCKVSEMFNLSDEAIKPDSFAGKAELF